MDRYVGPSFVGGRHPRKSSSPRPPRPQRIASPPAPGICFTPGPRDSPTPGPRDSFAPAPGIPSPPAPGIRFTPGPRDSLTPGPRDLLHPRPPGFAHPRPPGSPTPGPRDSSPLGDASPPAPGDSTVPRSPRDLIPPVPGNVAPGDRPSPGAPGNPCLAPGERLAPGNRTPPPKAHERRAPACPPLPPHLTCLPQTIRREAIPETGPEANATPPLKPSRGVRAVNERQTLYLPARISKTRLLLQDHAVSLHPPLAATSPNTSLQHPRPPARAKAPPRLAAPNNKRETSSHKFSTVPSATLAKTSPVSMIASIVLTPQQHQRVTPRRLPPYPCSCLSCLSSALIAQPNPDVPPDVPMPELCSHLVFTVELCVVLTAETRLSPRLFTSMSDWLVGGSVNS